jgi:hypothetical protein
MRSRRTSQPMRLREARARRPPVLPILSAELFMTDLKSIVLPSLPGIFPIPNARTRLVRVTFGPSDPQKRAFSAEIFQRLPIAPKARAPNSV